PAARAGGPRAGASRDAGATRSASAGLRQRHPAAVQLPSPPGQALAVRHSPGGGRPPGGQRPGAAAGAAAQRPLGPDGVPRGGARGGPADAGGNRRPGGPGAPGWGRAPLPTRPAPLPAVPLAGPRPPVPPHMKRGGDVTEAEWTTETNPLRLLQAVA